MSDKVKRGKDSISNLDESVTGCAIIWQDSIGIKIIF